jgi:hypothetical protein
MQEHWLHIRHRAFRKTNGTLAHFGDIQKLDPLRIRSAM